MKFVNSIRGLFLITVMFLCVGSAAVSGQVAANGAYTLQQSVVASGGGSSTGGGRFGVDGTAGQPAAGVTSANGGYGAAGGFWQAAIAPTAATVTISGRVLTSADGRGLRRALVTLTDRSGAVRQITTGALGNYQFADVEAGQTYIVTVASRRFSFAPKVITINDDLTGFDLIAQ